MPAVNHKLLRDRRDELDLSNGELADLIKVSYKYLSNVVSGTDEPSMRVVHRFARVLDLDPKQITAGPTPNGDPSEPPKQPAKDPKAPPTRGTTERTKGPRRSSSKAAA